MVQVMLALCRIRFVFFLVMQLIIRTSELQNFKKIEQFLHFLKRFRYDQSMFPKSKLQIQQLNEDQIDSAKLRSENMFGDELRTQ